MKFHGRMARLFLAALVLFAAAPVHAYELAKDASGEVARWKGTLRWKLDKKLAKTLDEPKVGVAIAAALDEMAPKVAPLALTLEQGGSLEMGYDADHPADNECAIIALEDWPYGDKVLAVTVVTRNAKTHEILDADIAFNAEKYTFAVLPGPGEPRTAAQLQLDDVQNTFTHELGHALGLAHNPEAPKAVMFPGAVTGEVSKRKLSADDEAGLSALYSGLEVAPEATPTTGCSAAPGALLLPLALAFVRRRRKAVAAVAAVAVVAVALPALAEEPVVQGAAAQPVSATVSQVVTPVPKVGQKVWWSQVTVRRSDEPGASPIVLLVPGGRFGDLEQEVAHLKVPKAGEAVKIVQQPDGRWLLEGQAAALGVVAPKAK